MLRVKTLNMPTYAPRHYFNRRIKKKRSTRRGRVYGYRGMKKFMWNVARQFHNSRVEHKNNDVNLSSSTNTGVITELTDISRGTADTGERVGDKIYLKYIKLYGTVEPESIGTVFRLIIFQTLASSELTGFTPVTGDVLESNSVNAFYNHDMSGVIRILYDRRVALNYQVTYDGAALVDGEKDLRIFDWTIPMWKKKFARKMITYDGTKSTDAYGACYALLLDNQATTHPTVSINVRVGYTDA